jgi:NUMOD3 motif/HNH endonuclease
MPPPKRGTPEYYVWIQSPTYKNMLKKCSIASSGENNPMFGQTHGESARTSISKSRFGTHASDITKSKMSESRSGENHPLFGKHHTEDSCKKMSNSRVGRRCGIENPFFGKHHSSETLLKISGEKSPHWKGGTSYFPYCEKFNKNRKKATRKFFNNCCIVCGKHESENIVGNRQVSLSVHHIDHDKNQGCDGKPFNLVPLCHKCHNMEISNEEEYKEYINKTLKEGFDRGIWSKEQYEHEVMY